MRILSWLYNGAINLVALAIVVGMFRVAQTPFETVVVAALTLIYVGAGHTGVTLAAALESQEVANYSRFLTLRGLLGTPTDESEREVLTGRG